MRVAAAIWLRIPPGKRVSGLAQIALPLDRHLGTLFVGSVVGGDCATVGPIFVLCDAVGPRLHTSVICAVEGIAAAPEPEHEPCGENQRDHLVKRDLHCAKPPTVQNVRSRSPRPLYAGVIDGIIAIKAFKATNSFLLINSNNVVVTGTLTEQFAVVKHEFSRISGDHSSDSLSFRATRPERTQVRGVMPPDPGLGTGNRG